MSVLEHFIVGMIISFKQLRCSDLRTEGIWEEELDEPNNLKVPMMVWAKIRNLQAMGQAFAPKLKGLA